MLEFWQFLPYRRFLCEGTKIYPGRRKMRRSWPSMTQTIKRKWGDFEKNLFHPISRYLDFFIPFSQVPRGEIPQQDLLWQPGLPEHHHQVSWLFAFHEIQARCSQINLISPLQVSGDKGAILATNVIRGSQQSAAGAGEENDSSERVSFLQTRHDSVQTRHGWEA